MSRPVALVTGASSGIGLSFAHQLARRGYDLVLVARRVDRLEKIASDLSREHSIDCRVEGRDLSDPSAVSALVADLERDSVEVEVLINNAGYGLSGAYHSQPRAGLFYTSDAAVAPLLGDHVCPRITQTEDACLR